MIKVTFYWTQVSSRVMGWSESFWANYSNIDDTMRGYTTEMLGLLYAIKGYQTASLGYRIAVFNEDGSPTRRTFLSTPEVPEIANANVQTTTDSDFPTVAYLLKASGGTPIRSTTQWIRGIADDAVTKGGRIAPQFNRVPRNQLIQRLQSAPWGIHSRSSALNPKLVIDDFDPDTDTFTTALDHGFFPDTRVSLTGIKTSPRLATPVTGQYSVSATPTSKTFRLAGFNIPNGITVFLTRRAKVQKLQFFVTGAEWQFVRTTSRQAGRPFGSPSGRVRRT